MYLKSIFALSTRGPLLKTWCHVILTVDYILRFMNEISFLSISLSLFQFLSPFLNSKIHFERGIRLDYLWSKEPLRCCSAIVVERERKIKIESEIGKASQMLQFAKTLKTQILKLKTSRKTNCHFTTNNVSHYLLQSHIVFFPVCT